MLSTVRAPDPSDPSQPADPAELVGAVVPPPAGMRAVSSLGIEILVPADWSINDTYCNQSSAPTAVRGHGTGADCYTPEPDDKDVAVIGTSDTDWLPIQLIEPYVNVPGAPAVTIPTIELGPTTVDGMPAERGLVALPDGRTAGLLRVAREDVAIAVRARDPAVVATILDSARLVGIDSAGCPMERPDALGFIDQSTDDPLATLDAVDNATLCSYPVRLEQTRLGSSVVIDGSDLDELVTAVHRLAFRGTLGDSCADPRPSAEEEVLIAFRLTDGSIRYLVVAQQGCHLVVIAATDPDPAFANLGLREVMARVLYGGPPLVQ